MFTKKDNTPTTYDDGAEPKQGKTALQSEQLLLLSQIADLKAKRLILDKRIEALAEKIAVYCKHCTEEPEYFKEKLFLVFYEREKLNEQIYELLDDRRCLKQKNSAHIEE